MNINIDDLVFLEDDVVLYRVVGKYSDLPEGLDGRPLWELKPVIDGLGRIITHGVHKSGLESKMSKATLRTAINRGVVLIRAYTNVGIT